MKTKLLSICFLASMWVWAQSPIDSFYPLNGTYLLVTSADPLDQTPSGANAQWTFNTLSSFGDTLDDYPSVSAEEQTTYPGTTIVSRKTTNIQLSFSESKLYSKNIGNEVSITGVKSDVELNFSTDNAVVGTFPLTYGYDFTDDLAGTYIYGTYNGTLTGTIRTSVDAYGILNTTVDGMAINNQEVTRLKSVQNITLNYGFIPNVGTIVKTVYNYYVSGSSTPVFRTSTTAVNVPLLAIDQVTEEIERYYDFFSVNENTANSNTLSLFPNPTNDVLHIDNRSAQTIRQITVTDLNGRVVMRSHGDQNSLSIGHLQQGIYTATFETEATVFTRKIVKN